MKCKKKCIKQNWLKSKKYGLTRKDRNTKWVKKKKEIRKTDGNTQ